MVICLQIIMIYNFSLQHEFLLTVWLSWIDKCFVNMNRIYISGWLLLSNWWKPISGLLLCSNSSNMRLLSALPSGQPADIQTSVGLCIFKLKNLNKRPLSIIVKNQNIFINQSSTFRSFRRFFTPIFQKFTLNINLYILL